MGDVRDAEAWQPVEEPGALTFAWGAPPPEQVIAHTNLYWQYQAAPGRTAGTVTTADVEFGAS